MPAPAGRAFRLVVASDYLVSVDTNRYSAPCTLIGQSTEVPRHDGWLEMRHRGEVVATHPLPRGQHRLWILPEHGPGPIARNARLRYIDRRTFDRRSPVRCRGPRPLLLRGSVRPRGCAIMSPQMAGIDEHLASDTRSSPPAPCLSPAAAISERADTGEACHRLLVHYFRAGGPLAGPRGWIRGSGTREWRDDARPSRQAPPGQPRTAAPPPATTPNCGRWPTLCAAPWTYPISSPKVQSNKIDRFPRPANHLHCHLEDPSRERPYLDRLLAHVR